MQAHVQGSDHLQNPTAGSAGFFWVRNHVHPQKVAGAEGEEAALLAEQGDRLAAEAAAKTGHSSGRQNRSPCFVAALRALRHPSTWSWRAAPKVGGPATWRFKGSRKAKERIESLDTCRGTLDTGPQGGPRFPELEVLAVRSDVTAADCRCCLHQLEFVSKP